MTFRHHIYALLAAGSLGTAMPAHAEEAAHQVLTAVSSTTLSGYVSTSAIWNFGAQRPRVIAVTVPGAVFDLFNTTLTVIQPNQPGAPGRIPGPVSAHAGSITFLSRPAADDQASLELRQTGDHRFGVIPATSPVSPIKAQVETTTAQLKTAGGNMYALAINRGTEAQSSRLVLQNGRMVLQSGTTPEVVASAR